MESSCKEIRIAICDDELSVCAQLEEMMIQIAKRLNIIFNIEPWYTGEALCEYLDKGNQFDLIFLDIELTTLSGIDVGHFIRDTLEDVQTQIIYISSKQNYALQLFKTQPYDFLVKPITEEELFYLLEKVTKLFTGKKHFFEYQYGREIFRVEYDKILYFKSIGHKIAIVLMHEELEFYGKLKDIIEIAPPQFFSIHKSFFVNKNYIVRYAYESVEMKNGEVLSISKSYKKMIRQMVSDLGKEK